MQAEIYIGRRGEARLLAPIQHLEDMEGRDNMDNPKKRKLSAQEKKRRRLAKQATAKSRRRTEGEAIGARFIAAYERWQMRDENEGPLMESCPGCGAPIVVRYEGGNIHPGHAMPACEGFEILTQLLGAPVHLESWSKEALGSALANSAPKIGFAEILAHWQHLPDSAFPSRERCPGCDLDVGADLEDGDLVHRHEDPHCRAYSAFAREFDAPA